MGELEANRRLFFVHWHAEEALRLARALQELGWSVVVEHGEHEVKLKDLKVAPPRAILISLQREPASGRDMADALWSVKWMRGTPIIFFDGEKKFVDRLRARFPRAVFTSWKELPHALNDLLSAG
jgi:hypothetical protein